ncbi:uncharacterized protein LOC101892649 isoform X1 [Musca domestica]|uniref:Uncharacterized protein LOC101892649 isoform X1 n=1 Tax=Musca domestica TaxID=7370 RepID=A0A9J7DDD2_MUSDO|nr:uncharacterized protein LOC101892649 isoform X1 [Musca domestica]
MKRRKVHIYFASLQTSLSLIALSSLLLCQQTDSAIIPPPWSDPDKNPCATMPGGWQLLYWPPLKKCFKIFSLGYPCPETMELSPTIPIGSSKKRQMSNAPVAECRCPPGTALSGQTNKCYKIYERGPCAKGQYFNPVAEMQQGNKRTTNRWGVCKTPKTCPENQLFWPQDGKCYSRLTKGPCTRGKLLVSNEDGLAECRCEDSGELKPFYYDLEDSCHEHFTKGPCSTPGHLFLPGGICDCHRRLPHYHEDYRMCYELNTPGPCPPGNIFTLPENVTGGEDERDLSTLMARAQCQCKEGYVPWSDGFCYRLYTRGPCDQNEFLVNATTCVENFCGKNRLYFPDQKQCYRIGSQGPCDLHQVVVFDFTARPSVDGISYNGMCGCAGIIMNLDQQCSKPSEPMTNTCESTPGMVELEGNCYKLYSRGPCGPGQWLEPIKSVTTSDTARRIQTKAKCVCRPGYTAVVSPENSTTTIERCNAPTVGLARYLTENSLQQRQNSKFPITLFSTNFPNRNF